MPNLDAATAETCRGRCYIPSGTLRIIVRAWNAPPAFDGCALVPTKSGYPGPGKASTLRSTLDSWSSPYDGLTTTSARGPLPGGAGGSSSDCDRRRALGHSQGGGGAANLGGSGSARCVAGGERLG